MEGAGEVLAVGEGVTDLAVGDRVAYAGALGAYADERLIAADRLVRTPDAISDVAAASMMLPGHDRPVPPQEQLSGEGG